MAVSSERKKKRDKYFKLRRNHSWFSVMVFIMTSLIALSMIPSLGAMFLAYTVNSHIEQEYDAKSALVDLYEQGLTAENNEYSVFDLADMDYFIRDRHGETIHSKGKITCSDNGGNYLTMYDDTDDNDTHPDDGAIYIYADSENSIVTPTYDGKVNVDLKEIAQLGSEAFRKLINSNEAAANEKLVDMPVWISINMKGGEQTLIFRSQMALRTYSVGMVIGMFACLMILLFIVLISMITGAVRSASDHKRIKKLFFTDMTIQANNWMWFLYNSERMLRTHRSAKKTYALIDLEFVGYRRFCACNSVDEGVTILTDVYNKLTSLLNKKELCAINTDGSFALLLEYTDEEDLKAYIENIVSAVSRIHEGLSLPFHAGVYLIGKSPRRRKNIDIESDFANASAACASLADSDGTGIAYYDEKIVEEQRWKDTVAQMQQKAIDNEEFLVYYQPKYDPATHELRGAEALIRWQSPEYGFLPPYKFIPIFEKNGFITEIDHYMITHAARDQKRWMDAGLHCVPVSVNISRAHFIEEDLAEQIRDTIDREGTPHKLIEIELTESAFFDDKKAIIKTIRRLQDYGFTVSMDDFGSGYSSLNSLKDMPLDVLKLDADFFRGEAAATHRGEVVVSEAIKLAKSLDMRTVAEGVESKEQVDFLASKGCDMIQGYYFAKPMPADDYEQRIRSGRSDPEKENSVEVKFDPPKEYVKA